MRDVWVEESSACGIHVYYVMVDGKPYDQFVATHWLTWSEQLDVAAGYREALDAYSICAQEG